MWKITKTQLEFWTDGRLVNISEFQRWFLLGNHNHQANPHVHQQHIVWATTFRSGLPQPLSSHVDLPVSPGSKESSYILVGFRSLLAIWLDKGWGNPDRNVIAQIMCCWWTCGFAWWYPSFFFIFENMQTMPRLHPSLPSGHSDAHAAVCKEKFSSNNFKQQWPSSVEWCEQWFDQSKRFNPTCSGRLHADVH